MAFANIVYYRDSLAIGIKPQTTGNVSNENPCMSSTTMRLTLLMFRETSQQLLGGLP